MKVDFSFTVSPSRREDVDVRGIYVEGRVFNLYAVQVFCQIRGKYLFCKRKIFERPICHVLRVCYGECNCATRPIW